MQGAPCLAASVQKSIAGCLWTNQFPTASLRWRAMSLRKPVSKNSRQPPSCGQNGRSWWLTLGMLIKPDLKTCVLISILRLYMMAYSTSLEGQVTSNLSVFATSAFDAHSLISTVMVIQGVVLCKILCERREKRSLISSSCCETTHGKSCRCLG